MDGKYMLMVLAGKEASSFHANIYLPSSRLALYIFIAVCIRQNQIGSSAKARDQKEEHGRHNNPSNLSNHHPRLSTCEPWPDGLQQ
jgi:hypothetical protein